MSIRTPSGRRGCLPGVVVLALGLAGCGQGSARGTPQIAQVPLAHGTRVVSQVRRCDRGAHAYCAVQFVLVGLRYPSSQALSTSQLARLTRAGWNPARGTTVAERSAESNAKKLRVTFATAYGDLLSIDEGTIRRSPRIARALSAQLFARAPALSFMVQTGSS